MPTSLSVCLSFCLSACPRSFWRVVAWLAVAACNSHARLFDNYVLDTKAQGALYAVQRHIIIDPWSTSHPQYLLRVTHTILSLPVLCQKPEFFFGAVQGHLIKEQWSTSQPQYLLRVTHTHFCLLLCSVTKLNASSMQCKGCSHENTGVNHLLIIC